MSRKIISIILTITFLSTVLFGTVPPGEVSIFKTSNLRKAGLAGTDLSLRHRNSNVSDRRGFPTPLYGGTGKSRLSEKKSSAKFPYLFRCAKAATVLFLFNFIIVFQLFTAPDLRANQISLSTPPIIQQIQTSNLPFEELKNIPPLSLKDQAKALTAKIEKMDEGDGGIFLDFEKAFYSAEHSVGGGDSIYSAKKRLDNAIRDYRKVLYGSIGDLFLDMGKATDINWIFKLGAYLTPSKLQRIAVASARVQEAVHNRILTEYLWAVEFTANYQKLYKIQGNLESIKESILTKISKDEDLQEGEIAIFSETFSRFKAYQARMSKLSVKPGNVSLNEISNPDAVKFIKNRLSVLVVQMFIRVKIGTWTEEYKDIFSNYKKLLEDNPPETAIEKAVKAVQAKQGMWQKFWKTVTNRRSEGEELIGAVRAALNTSPYLTSNSAGKDLLAEKERLAFIEKFPRLTVGAEVGKEGDVWDNFRFGFGMKGSFTKLLFDDRYEIPAAEIAKLAFYDNYLERSFRIAASGYRLNLWKEGKPSLDDELKAVEGDIFLKTIGKNLGGTTENMMPQNIFNGLDEDIKEELKDYLPMDLDRVPSEIWSGKDLLDIALANSPLTYIDAIKRLNARKQADSASGSISDWWKWGGGIIPMNLVPAGGFVLENRGLEEDIAKQAEVLAEEEALENRSLLFINALKTLAEYRYLEELNAMASRQSDSGRVIARRSRSNPIGSETGLLHSARNDTSAEYGIAGVSRNNISIELKKLKYRWRMLCGGVPLPDIRTINRILSPGYVERFFRDNHIGYANSLSKMSLGVEYYGKKFENAVMNKRDKEVDLMPPIWFLAAELGAVASAPPAWLVGFTGIKIVAPLIFPPSANKDAQEMLARKIEQKEESFENRRRLFMQAQERLKRTPLPRGRTPETQYRKTLIGIEKAAYTAPIKVIGGLIRSALDNKDIGRAVSLWFKYNGSSLFEARGSSNIGKRLRNAVNSDIPEAVEFRQRIEDYIWDKLGGKNIFSKAAHLWDDKDYKTAQRIYNRGTVLGMIFSPELEQEFISNYKHLRLQPGMKTELKPLVKAGNYTGAAGAYRSDILPDHIKIPKKVTELEKAGKYSDAEDYVRRAIKTYEARGEAFEEEYPKIAKRYDRLYHRYNLFAGRPDHYYEISETRAGTSYGERYRIEGKKRTYLPHYRLRTDSVNLRTGMNVNIKRNDLYNPFKTDFENAYGWGSLAFPSLFQLSDIQIDPRISLKPYKDDYRKVISLSLSLRAQQSNLVDSETGLLRSARNDTGGDGIASASPRNDISRFLKLKNLNWWIEGDDRGPDEPTGYKFYGSETITGNIGMPYSITGTSDLTDIDRYGIEEGLSGEHSLEGSIGTEKGLFVGVGGYYRHNRENDFLVKSFSDQYFGSRSLQITSNYDDAGKYSDRFRSNLWAEYDLRKAISLTQGLWQDKEDIGKYNEWKGIGVIAGRQWTEFADSKDYLGLSYDIGESGKIAYLHGVNNNDSAAGVQRYSKDGKYFAGASWSNSEVTPDTEYQRIDAVFGARGELSPVFRVSLNPKDSESLTGEMLITAGSSTYGGNIYEGGYSFSAYEDRQWELTFLRSDSKLNRYYSNNTAYQAVRPRPLWLSDNEEGEGYDEFRLRLHLTSGEDFRIPGTDFVKKALSMLNGSEYIPSDSAEKSAVGTLSTLVNYLESYRARILEEAASIRGSTDILPWKGAPLTDLTKSIETFAESANQNQNRIGNLEGLQDKRLTAIQKRLRLEEKVQKAKDSIAKKELNAELKKVKDKIQNIAKQEKAYISDIQELIINLKEVQTAHNAYAESRRAGLSAHYKERLPGFNALVNEFDRYLAVSMGILRGFEEISRINTIEQFRSAAERFASLSEELDRRFPWMDFTRHIQNIHRRLMEVGRMFEKLARHKRNLRLAPSKTWEKSYKSLDESV